MKTLLVVAPALALALLACGKKAEKPAGGSAGSAVAANKPPIDAGATATVDAKGAPAKPTKISKATRADLAALRHPAGLQAVGDAVRHVLHLRVAQGAASGLDQAGMVGAIGGTAVEQVDQLHVLHSALAPLARTTCR